MQAVWRPLTLEDCLDASDEPRVMVFGYGRVMRGNLIGWDDSAGMPRIQIDDHDWTTVVPIWQVHVFK